MVFKRLVVTTAVTQMALLSLAPPSNAGEPPLRLSASLHQPRVLDRCPIIVKLEVTNTSSTAIKERFSAARPDYLRSHCELNLKDADDRVYLLDWEGGQPDEGMYGPGLTIAAGEVVRADWVVIAVIPVRDKHRGKSYSFLPPGEYTGRVRLGVLGGIIESDELSLTIQEPTGDDARARDLIAIRHGAFFQGKGSALGYADYLGGRAPMKGSTHAIFGEMETVLRSYPESPYAEWIGFRKLFYGLDGEHATSRADRCAAALRYVNANPEFPLSDNLGFEAARRLMLIGDYVRARDLTARLIRDFPNGDYVAKAQELRGKLTKKFPPE